MSTVSVDARKLIAIVVGISFLVGLGGVTSAIIHYGLGHDTAYGFVPEFDLDQEANVPAWYSSSLLLLSGFLLAFSGLAIETGRRHWTTLATIFVFLSMDEVAGIHERLSRPLRDLLDADGPFLYTWVVIGILFVMVVGVTSIDWLGSLPRRISGLFAIAGGLYVGGAIGMEMVMATLDGALNLTGPRYFSPVRAGVSAVEELLEIAGLTVFVCALLLHLSTYVTRVEVSFVTANPDGQARPGAQRSSSGAPVERIATK